MTSRNIIHHCQLLVLHSSPIKEKIRVCSVVSFLCGQNYSSADILDLLLSQLGDKPGLNDHGLVGQLALPQHLEDAVLSHINDRCNTLVLSMAHSGLQAFSGILNFFST